MMIGLLEYYAFRPHFVLTFQDSENIAAYIREASIPLERNTTMHWTYIYGEPKFAAVQVKNCQRIKLDVLDTIGNLRIQMNPFEELRSYHLHTYRLINNMK